MDLKLNSKVKRGIVIAATAVLGANAVLVPFNIKVLNDLLATTLFAPITVGLIAGAAGVFSAWMLITKKM